MLGVGRMMMAAAIAAGGPITTFNPAATGGGIALSNANRTATNAGATGTVLLTPVLPMAKVVFGFQWISGVGSVGVATASKALNVGLGDAQGWEYIVDGEKAHNNLNSTYGSSYTAGDIVYVYVDPTAGQVWWSKNGDNQGGGNPAAGTGAAYSGLPSTLYGAAAFVSGGSATLLTSASELVFPIASGFSLVS